MKEKFFIFIFIIITITQCDKIIQNTKNGKKYDSGVNIFYSSGVIISMYFLNMHLKKYGILLYGISMILSVSYSYLYHKKNKNFDILISIKKDLLKLIIVFTILILFIFVIIP